MNEALVNHQKELLKNSIETQEKERKRIAENLHDDLISQLYRIKLMNDDAAINELVKKGITTTRTISHLLSPPLLEQTSFKELIIDFMVPYEKEYKVNFVINSEERIDNITDKLNFFRIFQEVITNCNKHAKANAIEIVWRIAEKRCCLIIRDNGIGLNAGQKKGLGFKNIESRTQLLNGSYKFKDNQPKGTTFILVTERS
ncbi:MAG: sensor histidine kinase [Aureispira sp.]